MTGLLQLLLLVSTALGSEPSRPACSKYDYEENVLERMIRMEFTVEQHLARLKNDNKRLSAVVDALMDQQELAERRLASLMEEVERNRITTLEMVVANSNNTLEQISAAVDNLKESTPTCHPETIAFYAYLGGNVNLNEHAVIMFNVEETDTRNSYNIHNGTFTAPVSGVYVLSITIYSGTNSYVGAEIIVNNDIKGEAFADAQEIGDTHSASATIVVQMTAGQYAYVRRGQSSLSVMWSHASRGRSSFSGWLLC
ncbi:hypothetical protein MAR_030836 [Mya arenaria]|uniref:C1q domain-containing protein n=1 Tax=Mya arenaria TaxID=6604 RepID=A0ABY7F5C0_MYAAR|nr:complement C1q tumor necrosis factor-related protein 3-like [Mya arenaria]WAR16242.1 hypothetical protein MAR_030836 [Mya arenaria]